MTLAPTAPATPAAPAGRTAADVRAEIDAIDKDLGSIKGDQFGNVGPGTAYKQNQLRAKRKTLTAERDQLETAERNKVLKATAPIPVTKANHDLVKNQLNATLREEDSMYSATDPTILDLLEKALKEPSDGPRDVVTIGPPSEAELSVPRYWAELLVKARQQKLV